MDQNLYSSLLAPFQELYAQTVDSMNKQEGELKQASFDLINLKINMTLGSIFRD